MKKSRWVAGWIAWTLAVGGELRAQTEDPAKVQDLQNRFHQGLQLENDAKYPEALAVFQGIIKDEPKAMGSLFYAGMVSLEMGHAEEAVDYLNRFRELSPKDFKGVVLLIQANQALRRTVKVEALRRELLAMRSADNIPGLTDAKSYVRERVRADQGNLIDISEFFDYTTDPNFVYLAEEKNPALGVLRRLVIFFNSDETKAARARNEKFAEVEVFDFSEDVIKDGKSAQVNIYRQEYEKPSYETARKWILDAIKEPPKPLMVAPLP